MKNISSLAENMKGEYSENGIRGIIKKGSRKVGQALFYTTCSLWYECDTTIPVRKIFPAGGIKAIFLTENKNELIDWLKYNSGRFPWIYSEEESSPELFSNHRYLILKDGEIIIGYIKIGVGETYINDFGRTVVFEPGTAFIYDTFILPKYRGRSLAVYAITEVAHYCRKNGFNRILCHIEKWNTASIRAFKRSGFQAGESIRLIRIAGISFYLRSGLVPSLSLEKALLTRNRAAGEY